MYMQIIIHSSLLKKLYFLKANLIITLFIILNSILNLNRLL